MKTCGFYLNVFLSCFALSGCDLTPKYSPPRASLPKQWTIDTSSVVSFGAGPIAELSDESTKTPFYSTEPLSEIISLALDRNHQIKGALNQAAASEALFQEANASLFPELDGGANVHLQKYGSGIVNIANKKNAFVTRYYGIGFGISAYEVDFWGKIRNMSNASFQRYLSDYNNVITLRLSITAAIATSYLNFLADRNVTVVYYRILDLLSEDRELLTSSKRTGWIDGADLDTVDTSIADIKLLLSEGIDRQEKNLNSLILLTGGDESSALHTIINRGSPSVLLPVYSRTNVGVPSEVLRNRPDLRASEHLVRAANYDVGVAKAYFFPSFTITATNGTASHNPAQMFRSGMGAWNVAPQITIPILDEGRNVASLSYARRKYQQALEDYDELLAKATAETRNALADRERSERNMLASAAELKASVRLMKREQIRHKIGYSSRESVIFQQISVLDARIKLTRAWLASQLAEVSLYRATGGGGI